MKDDAPIDGGPALLTRIAEVAEAVGWQANVGASETAGLIVSCLAANPDLIDRFMTEGTERFIDGTIHPEKGCLTFHSMDGQIRTPEQLARLNYARRARAGFHVVDALLKSREAKP